MKKLLFASVVLASVASLFVNAYGQNTGGAAKKAAGTSAAEPPHKIGLIDMGRVFKEYKKFDALREDWKAELATNEDKAKQMAAKAKKLDDQMKQLKPGSDDFVKLEKQLTQTKAEFESFRNNSQRTLMQREADIYKTVYLETMKVVERMADTYKYTLVMRFNSENVEGEDLQKLQVGLNRVIVYHRNEDDLTDGVIDYLNRKYSAGGPQVSRGNGANNQ